MRLINIVRERFGRWTVRAKLGRLHRDLLYVCTCDCGTVRSVNGAALRNGKSKSCGCHKNELIGRLNRIHGMRHTKEYEMWSSAKQRARQKNLPFTIKPSDVKIPSHCPILGLALRAGKKRFSNNSPTLDQVIPGKGYVIGNIRVISFRANNLKRDGTKEEFELLVRNWT